ncbi:MAG: hypothetical protein MUE40_12110 [Anaerolineae bacterium]|jgi:hypothetical protein|nr:hypothetical protein [Anaerolineae bacterium]
MTAAPDPEHDPDPDPDPTAARASRIQRLLDAIDMIQDNQRDRAVPLLRQLIGEDQNFEAAWLWMSVAVDSLDKSIICLDNVLRINPHNVEAAGALHRLRQAEMGDERRRIALRQARDTALILLWLLVFGLLYAIVHSYWTMPISPRG